MMEKCYIMANERVHDNSTICHHQPRVITSSCRTEWAGTANELTQHSFAHRSRRTVNRCARTLGFCGVFEQERERERGIRVFRGVYVCECACSIPTLHFSISVRCMASGIWASCNGIWFCRLESSRGRFGICIGGLVRFECLVLRCLVSVAFQINEWTK